MEIWMIIVGVFLFFVVGAIIEYKIMQKIRKQVLDIEFNEYYIENLLNVFCKQPPIIGLDSFRIFRDKLKNLSNYIKENVHKVERESHFQKKIKLITEEKINILTFFYEELDDPTFLFGGVQDESEWDRREREWNELGFDALKEDKAMFLDIKKKLEKLMGLYDKTLLELTNKVSELKEREDSVSFKIKELEGKQSHFEYKENALKKQRQEIQKEKENLQKSHKETTINLEQDLKKRREALEAEFYQQTAERKVEMETKWQELDKKINRQEEALGEKNKRQEQEIATEKEALKKQKEEIKKLIKKQKEASLGKLSFFDLLKACNEQLPTIEKSELKGKTHASLFDFFRAVQDTLKVNKMVTPDKLLLVPEEVERIDQIEAVLDLYDEKILRVKNDDSLDEIEQEEKIEYWKRLRDRDIASIEA